MTRVLLRAGKSPLQALSPEAAFAFGASGVFGQNVGNLAFGDSVFRLLSVPGTEVVPDSFLTERTAASDAHAARINAEFSAFVIPLANAFRPAFTNTLIRLTQTIEKLTIPTVVVGVGANKTMLGDDALQAAVKRFMAAVLDRSAKVGVRGDVTREYLAGLGFGDQHVEVIGCPSVFLRGPNTQVVKKLPELTPDAKVNLTLSPYVAWFADLMRQAITDYPNLVYIPQRYEDLALMLWGHQDPAWFRYSRDYPVHPDHQLYREDRMRFFCDTRTWADFNSGRDYSVGTRIHGTVMALVAGTPATIVTHDVRTAELAEYHEIPHTTGHVLQTEFPTLSQLYEQADFTAFNTGMASRYQVLTGFLERNGLEHIAQPGKANPQFDAELAKLPLASPVHTLCATGEPAQDALIRRMDWLYQTATRGPGNQTGAYQPPFVATPPPPVRGVKRVVRGVNRRLRRVLRRVGQPAG